jgi:two-component system OmpR family response regulator/two-component system alkaline phosphatase synthesis response regulator PhoP
MSSSALLIVDDDSDHNCEVANHFRQLNFEVLFARTKEEALRLLQNREIQVTLLEIGLGEPLGGCAEHPAQTTGLPGLEMLEILRNRWSHLPVIVVTDRFDPLNETISILNGADAFLRKPVDLNLLTAYIHGKLKSEILIGNSSKREMYGSCEPLTEIDFVTVEGLIIDLANLQVKGGDGPYQSLSRREASLLRLLGSYPHRVFSREELLRRVWGNDSDHGYDAVDAAIKRVRKKIERTPNGHRLLATVRGKGYILSG